MIGITADTLCTVSEFPLKEIISRFGDRRSGSVESNPILSLKVCTVRKRFLRLWQCIIYKDMLGGL